MVVATIGLVFSLGVIARSISRVREEKAKDVPATSGELSPEPVWVRYHARYYGYALLFLAFDMEMAYMYPLGGRLQGAGTRCLARHGRVPGDPLPSGSSTAGARGL